MGLRFRKSVKLAPGIKLNLNKKSVGLSFGTRGAHTSINSKGTKTTSVGIPGTGLSYTSVSSNSKQSGTSTNKKSVSNTKEVSEEKYNQIPFYQTGFCTILMLILCFPIGLVLMWKYQKHWNKKVKIIITVFFSLIVLYSVLFNNTDSSDIVAEESIITEESTNITTTEPQETIPMVIVETTIEPTTQIPTTSKKVTTTKKVVTTTTKKETTTQKKEDIIQNTTIVDNKDTQITVYKFGKGECYHYDNTCNGKSKPIALTLKEAKEEGLRPCKKCAKKDL